MLICDEITGCGKPEPSSWCWENRDFDCPLGHPPRWATDMGAYEAYRCLKELHAKQVDLEERILKIESPRD